MTRIATLTLNPAFDGSSDSATVQPARDTLALILSLNRHIPRGYGRVLEGLTAIAGTTFENISQLERTGQPSHLVSVEMPA